MFIVLLFYFVKTKNKLGELSRFVVVKAIKYSLRLFLMIWLLYIINKEGKSYRRILFFRLFVFP